MPGFEYAELQCQNTSFVLQSFHTLLVFVEILFIFRSTLPNKAGIIVGLFVHRATKFFSDFNEIWCVDCRQRLLSDTRPYAVWTNQRWRSLVSKSYRNERFQSLSSLLVCMYQSQDLTMNYQTPRQYLNVNWTYFCYSSSFGVTWPSDLGCFCVIYTKQ